MEHQYLLFRRHLKFAMENIYYIGFHLVLFPIALWIDDQPFPDDRKY